MAFICSFKYFLSTGEFGSKWELKNHINWTSSATGTVNLETVFHLNNVEPVRHKPLTLQSPLQQEVCPKFSSDRQW